MRPPRTALLAAALILSGLSLIGLWLHKSVNLVVEGETRQITSMALTVSGLLREAGIVLGPEDELAPGPSEWLSDGDVVRVDRANLVQVIADGRAFSLWTTQRRPTDLLALAGITLSSGDRVLEAGIPVPLADPLPPAPAYTLQVRRAVPVTVFEGTESHRFRSAAATLGQALWEAGVQVHAADRITPSLDTPLGGPVEVTIHRARALSVQVAGTTLEVRSAADTVGAALAEAGLALQGLDYSMPPEGASLPADGRIRVVRVREEVILEQEPLPFETELQPDPELEIDQRRVLDPGRYGLLARRVRVRYEDGQELSRQVEGEWAALQPQPRRMGYGTKIVVRTLDTPAGPIEYWRAVTMYATSYSPCRIFRDRCSFRTASGATLRKGVAAVVVRWYPFMGGTNVYVPGYGVATILDTGGGIPGRHWIDLGYSDDDYRSWHHWVTVYFLTPIPPPDRILYILN